jgi:hypothetical protein
LLLTQLFTTKKLFEGGNLSTATPGWMGVAGDHEANEIELKIHNRSFMVGILDKLLRNIDKAYAAQFKSPIWSPELLNKRTFLSGSSLHFFNVKDIPDEVFVQKKPKVGDIDTQIDANLEPNIEQFLKSITGKQVGNATFLGYKYGNNQYSSLWELKEVPVKIQIDFEFGRYDPKTNEPDQWFAYSHSSEWNDVEVGIKGVFHKYLNRALAAISTSEKYVARVLKKSTKISPEPVTDNDLSFAVSGPGGGGMSRKYVPYVDPSTGEPMVQNGIPVMRLLEPKDRDYIQNLGQQFELIYGRKPSKQDNQLMNSFLGTIDLMNKYLNDQQRASVANDFLEILFSPGAQMLTKDDPSRDREAKFAAIDSLVEKLKLPDGKSYRQQAVNMAKAYEDSFLSKKKPLAEADVKAQLRKGMPHLHDLKSADFLDLLDELHQGNGQFKLQNIPLNVKIDGFGGRFGKNAEGKPFMGTSRTEPRYQAGFVDYHQKKGTTDPEILGRAKLFDDLFDEMMEAVKLVDNKLGPKFLVNKQITCEVLYLPFATETPEGKLKFVGIHYDKLPQGVQLALVPFRVVDAETGNDLPDSTKVIKELTSVGKQGSVMFINNSLTQNEALDVTAIVPPLENIEQMKAMLASKKRDQAAEVKAALEPVKVALEKAIIEDPNIIGKDMLGKDYEGIVINSRLGPIKVTSQEQRDVISAKNAAMASARTERPRSEAKTAVVAIGSFVGHIGHEQLFDYTIKKAKAVGGDPYLFIGNAEGKADPIPPSVKVETWHKMYPQYSKNISTVNQEGGSLLQKIKHELINPLPGKPPRYDNIIIMVGEDQAGLTMPQALMKAVNKFQGYEHVKVSLEATPRGTGMSFTKLRNILKDPNATPDQQLQVWSQGFDVNKLGVDWIKHLMDLTRKGMGIQMSQKQQPVVAERLLNALICPKEDLEETKRMSAAMKLQRAWDRERAKSDASRERMRRELELIGGKKPQEDPKKDQGTSEAANAAQQAAIAIAKKKKQKGVAEATADPYRGLLMALRLDAGHYIDTRGQAGGRNFVLDINQRLAQLQQTGNPRAKIVGDTVKAMMGDAQRTAASTKGVSFGTLAHGLMQLTAQELQKVDQKPVPQPAQQGVAEGSEQITELRDRMYQYIKSIVPAWPDYVVQDWLYKGGKTDTKDNIIEKISGAGLTPNSKWQLVPNMKFTMDMFDPMTKQRLVGRAGGTSDLGMGIPKDKERHATQAALAQQQGGVRKEPVLLIKTAKGYELLEGWHRTIQHFAKYPEGYTGPAYVAVAQGQQGVAEGSDKECPPATQDIKLNLKNRQKAIDEYGYGPLNPDMPNRKFWMAKVDEWNLDSAEEAKQSLCGNCAAFDQRKHTLDCIAQGIDSNSPNDAEGVIDAGDLGYCKFLKFKCASRRTCDAWVTGGPLTDKQGVAEGKEQFNYELAQKGFHFEQEINGVTYKVYNKKGGSDNIKIDALDQKKQVIGHASFSSHQYQDGLESLSTSVEPAWQGKGIATNMYAVMRMLGVNIHPASTQSDDGKKMWSKWRKQGDAQHIKSLNAKMAEGGAKYQVKSIGKDKKGEYYISPSTGQKVYKKAKVGDHEVPGSKEIKPKVEAMLPKSAFAGSDKNKLGPAGQWRNKGPKANKPAKAGDLVGGAAESAEKTLHNSNPCWKGYHPVGTKKKGGKTVPNCVPVSESAEKVMVQLIKMLESKR